MAIGYRVIATWQPHAPTSILQHSSQRSSQGSGYRWLWEGSALLPTDDCSSDDAVAHNHPPRRGSTAIGPPVSPTCRAGRARAPESSPGHAARVLGPTPSVPDTRHWHTGCLARDAEASRALAGDAAVSGRAQQSQDCLRAVATSTCRPRDQQTGQARSPGTASPRASPDR
jgi:hypothetical protein